MQQVYDLVIVGTGWFGLAAAKAYAQLHPEANFVLFESAESCGGTWSRNRLYPGLASNNMADAYEYPDFPMAEEKYGIKLSQHIPGTVLHQYLTDFAKNFNIFDRIQFNTRVENVASNGSGGWRVSVISDKGTYTIDTAKLILATGLTSTPNMPQYKNSERFGAPIFHAKYLSKEAPNLKDVKSAVVIGGGKSAYDAAYALAEDGALVDLIIRPNGHGPTWISPMLVTPFKRRIDHLLNIRWMTWFSPCPWGAEDGHPLVRRFLHGTSLGRFLVDTFWKVLTSDIVSANNYDSHSDLQKLRPWHSAFWIGSRLGVFNYDKNLFDLVREGKIRVHSDNIERLEPRKVILESGNTLDADAIICSTGWRKESCIKFINLDLGLSLSDSEQMLLNQEADGKVFTLFPRLRNQPKFPSDLPESDLLRYYRFMIPSAMINSRNFAFVGMVSCVCTSTCAALQGLWVTAFFDGALDRILTSKKEIVDEIMLHNQWGKWRHPTGYGASFPDMAFEGLSYLNLLMRDLGLEINRKGSYFAEITSPYTPKDFHGLIDEWQLGHGRD